MSPLMWLFRLETENVLGSKSDHIVKNHRRCTNICKNHSRLLMCFDIKTRRLLNKIWKQWGCEGYKIGSLSGITDLQWLLLSSWTDPLFIEIKLFTLASLIRKSHKSQVLARARPRPKYLGRYWSETNRNTTFRWFYLLCPFKRSSSHS